MTPRHRLLLEIAKDEIAKDEIAQSKIEGRDTGQFEIAWLKITEQKTEQKTEITKLTSIAGTNHEKNITRTKPPGSDPKTCSVPMLKAKHQ